METWKKVRKWLLPAAVTLLALGLVLCLIIPSFAWLKTSREAPFRLGADPVPDIALYMGVYDSSTGGYHWSEPLQMKDMRTAQSFGKPLQDSMFPQDPTNAGARVNAAMGVIDQLDPGSLDASNYTWFCIRVHEDEGLKFKDIKLEYAQEPFQFFGSDWDTKGNPGRIHHMPASGTGVGATLQQIFANDNVIPKMMEIAVPTQESGGFITATAPADGMAMPAVSGTCGYAGRQGNAAALPDQNTTGILKAGADGCYTVDKVDQNGYYYIYFRMGPNLDAYYLIVDSLFLNMPCYLSFDGLTVSIDVKK